MTVAKLDEVVKERNHLEQRMISLVAKFENTNQVKCTRELTYVTATDSLLDSTNHRAAFCP